MARLRPRQRAALSLYYAEDMTLEAVAHVLGTKPSAAKQLLARARDAVRQQYKVAAKGVET